MDTPPSPPDLATLITATREGQREALDQLVQFLYQDLHGLARRQMAGERPDHTLQPTALVSEAVLRLLGGAELSFADRAHFLGAAAHAMRHALIDHARARRAIKRDGGLKVTLDPEIVGRHDGELDAMELEEALSRLAQAEPRWAKVVELRFLAGMEVDEVASVLQVSERTVKRDWRFARAWLARELSLGRGTDD